MRISLTSHDSDFLQTIDVASDLKVQDLKSLVEAMLGDSSITLYFHASPLLEMQKTLGDVGIREEDMVLIKKQTSMNESFEGFRQQLLNSPPLQQQLQRENPMLLQAAQQGAEPFARLMMQGVSRMQQGSMQQSLANADPFDIDAQKRIEEAIRLEQVVSNFELAMEHHPEAFGQVHMLYIQCEVNGVKVKALVDSGAQTTIISPVFAEKCGLMRLLDTRFRGMAKGVGTANILGRIHATQIKVGQVFLMCSFTVMEGRHVDFLFGLDMLKRHQAILDFDKNVLRIQGESVPFLSEGDIPHSPTFEPPPQGSTNPSTPAMASSSSTDPKLQTLVDMGASVEEAKRVLEATNGNLDMAASMLFHP